MTNEYTILSLQCPCSGGPGNPILLLVVVAGLWLLFNWIKTLIKSKGNSFMNKAMKIVIVIALILVVGVVFALKQKDKGQSLEPAAVTNSEETITESSQRNSKNAEVIANLPRLVDLGADKCIPCKMMAPILEELKKDYDGTINVEFIDVWKEPDRAKEYGISIIPTQIFFDASGKELFRHEGFFSKEDILGKWKEFGINLEGGKQNESNE
jgi:thioredoxin 1